MAVDLPEVTQKFEADVRPYIDALALAAQAAAEFADANREAVDAVAALSAAMRSVPAADYRDALVGARVATGSLSRSTGALVRAEGRFADAANEATNAAARQAAVMAAKADAVARLAGIAALLSAAERDLGSRTTSTAGAVNRTNGAWRAQIGWLRLTRATIHWVIAGFAEFAAVAIPAVVALSAAMLVGLQGGAEIVARDMKALFTATEATSAAFHKTTGDVLGLGHALQSAQDAANPGVYELLGSVINDAKTRFTDFAGAGLQVIHVMDAFAAKVTLDLKGRLGDQLGALLGNMSQDLTRFGQVLGNVGHALLNFAAAMPGLAEVLLAVIMGITGLLNAVSSLPAPIFTIIMAFEEFYRWGGVVLSMLVRMTGQMAVMDAMGATGFITRFGAAFRTLLSAGGAMVNAIGTWVANLGTMESASARAGIAISNAGRATQGFAAGISNLGAAGIAAIAAGVIILAFAVDKYRNSAQKFIDKTNQMVSAAPSASAAFLQLAKGISGATQQIQDQERVLHSYSQATQDAGGVVAGLVAKIQSMNGPLGGASQGVLNLWTRTNQWAEGVTNHIPVIGGIVRGAMGAFGLGASEAASKINVLTAAQKQWLAEAGNVLNNGHALAAEFGTSLTGAIGLADAAGVKLTGTWAKNGQAMKIAEQQIRNYLAGLGALKAPAGVIGADMEALGIQSQLAGTKVQELNSAWDAWMASVTGGLSAMSQVQVALSGIDKGALSANASLSGALRGVKLGTKDATYSLQGFGTTAMKSWQQFLGAVQPAQQAMDSLRVGMAEGAVTSRQFGSTVRGLVGEFLPFVKGNQDAVRVLSQFAHQAGGPVTGNLKQLAQWAGVTGKAARDQFARGMEAATASMSAMSKVAQNLSAVIGQQLDSAMAAAISKNSGLNDAITKYAADLKDASTPASVLRGDVLAISQAEQRATQMTAEASRGLDQAARSAAHAGAAARSAANDVSALVAAIDALHSKTININVITTHQGIFVGGGGPRAISGHASGTSFAQPGLAMVGERGPELIQARGGERIFSNPETAAILGGGQHPGLAAEAGGAAAAGPQAVELHSHIYIDGQQVFESMQQHGLVYNTRNSGARTGKYIPGP